MTVVILWLGATSLVVAFVIFLAIDDRKNQRIRAEEDRLKALQATTKPEQNAD